MGFFDTLRRVLHHDQGREKVASAWGLDEERADSADETRAGASVYDRSQWQKKVKRILAELPASQAHWPEIEADARALKLEPDWATKCLVDEFLLLVRRAVSDGHFTEAEHRKLDLARDLIGIPEAEAEAALHSIVAEAESFFGKPVEGA